jgi:hypothetical protein
MQWKPASLRWKHDDVVYNVTTCIKRQWQRRQKAVVPECVTGVKDEVDEDGTPIYEGIDQSKVVPLLTAALQEAIAKIETLEQRLTAAGID